MTRTPRINPFDVEAPAPAVAMPEFPKFEKKVSGQIEKGQRARLDKLADETGWPSRQPHKPKKKFMTFHNNLTPEDWEFVQEQIRKESLEQGRKVKQLEYTLAAIRYYAERKR
ncbi:hypothetical protein [Paludibacterium sp.]|uniref:hypothetical protein n=1 Tax=Paludibacterium sp. TaxID=1917523 RepID=UPI0025FF92B3|nr:hypothetical protein [Paludibacterium sp.]MBV8649632.1 hypothetical protein [Paludibacterium sp.]